MSKKKLIPAICILSVMAMFALMYFEATKPYAWLAVMAGGLVVAGISILGKKDQSES